MDMFLPLFPLHYLEVQGLGESTLGDDIRAVAASRGRGSAGRQGTRSAISSSAAISTASFAAAFPLWPSNSATARVARGEMRKDWLTRRYHAPSDDLNQPVDKTAAAAIRPNHSALVERVADAPSLPQWNPDSFFRRFAGE